MSDKVGEIAQLLYSDKRRPQAAFEEVQRDNLEAGLEQ
jgi:hypothetical protein